MLADYINPTAGCFLLEEGPGVYPVITEVNTIEDIIADSEFLLFMNTSYPARTYYVNQPAIDFCNLPAAGIYFNTSQKDNHLLDAYRASLASTEDSLTDELKTKLTTLDAARIWLVIVNVADKTGELITFQIHLAQLDGKIFIAAIDTRGCGV